MRRVNQEMFLIQFFLTIILLSASVTLGRRHFDPLFDVAIELPDPQDEISQNYVEQVQHEEMNNQEVDVEQMKRMILSNEDLMKRIQMKSLRRKSYPVLECLIKCDKHPMSCCRINYKKIPVKTMKPENDKETSYRSLAPAAISLIPGISGSLGVLGTVVGVMFAGYRVSRAWAGPGYTDVNSGVDINKKIFINAPDSNSENWIKQLERFLEKENIKDIDSFLCCLHTGIRNCFIRCVNLETTRVRLDLVTIQKRNRQS